MVHLSRIPLPQGRTVPRYRLTTYTQIVRNALIHEQRKKPTSLVTIPPHHHNAAVPGPRARPPDKHLHSKHPITKLQLHPLSDPTVPNPRTVQINAKKTQPSSTISHAPL